MTILITGAGGLIGTALVNSLRDAGDRILCQSRRHHEADAGVDWIEHDLVRDSWERLALPEIDVVYHLAGQTSTYAARADPMADLAANVTGLLRLLEYLKQQRRPPFVVLAGTVTELGVSDQLPIREDLPDRPVTFYDISKLTAEMYLKQYVREGWLRGCTLRLSNVFGRSTAGQQRDRGVIDRIFNRALAGERIEIYGDGSKLRDYLFIDDVVSALTLAASNAEHTSGRAFCIGSGRGTTLKEAFSKAIAMAATVTGTRVELEHVAAPAGLSEIEFRNAVVDSSAFTRATGWVPRYDFDSGLAAAYGDLLPGKSAQARR